MIYNCLKNCGECCKSVAIELCKHPDPDLFDWLESHENCSVLEKNGSYYVKFRTMCKHLIDGKCDRYETRPVICQVYNCLDNKFKSND
jgi:Fe-S-cluster containining protein